MGQGPAAPQAPQRLPQPQAMRRVDLSSTACGTFPRPGGGSSGPPRVLVGKRWASKVRVVSRVQDPAALAQAVRKVAAASVPARVFGPAPDRHRMNELKKPQVKMA